VNVRDFEAHLWAGVVKVFATGGHGNATSAVSNQTCPFLQQGEAAAGSSSQQHAYSPNLVNVRDCEAHLWAGVVKVLQQAATETQHQQSAIRLSLSTTR
jgi:hypothetical protein